MNVLSLLNTNLITALITSFSANVNKKTQKKDNCTSPKSTVNSKIIKNKDPRQLNKYKMRGKKSCKKLKTKVIGYNCNPNNKLVKKYNEGYYDFICFMDIDLRAKTLTILDTNSGEKNTYEHYMVGEYIEHSSSDKNSSEDSRNNVSGSAESLHNDATFNLIESIVKDAEDINITSFPRDL